MGGLISERDYNKNRKRDSKQSYSGKSQNTFCIYWFLIKLLKKHHNNSNSFQYKPEGGLSLGVCFCLQVDGLVGRGGVGWGGGDFKSDNLQYSIPTYASMIHHLGLPSQLP